MKLHQIVIDTIIWLVKKHPGIDFTTINEKCGETLQGIVTQKEFENQLVGRCLEKTAAGGYKYVSLEDIKGWNKSGVAYANGKGVKRDINKAVELYRKAAMFGCANAQCNMGVCYFKGEGVDRNVHAAIEYFGKAAIQNSIRAQEALVGCCQNEQIVNDNAKELFKWILMLAQKGLSHFQLEVARFFLFGTGVKKDVQEAIAWLLRSRGGCENYADVFNYTFPMMICCNDKSAVKSFNETTLNCANDGQMDAQIDALYLCGASCEFGVGSKILKESAAWFYLEAARAGHMGSQFRLAELLRNGLVLPEEYKTAEYWYRAASRKNHPAAEYAMGAYYSDTDTRAVYWFRRGAKHRCARAMYALGQCYEGGLSVPKDEKKAIDYYREAAGYREPLAEKRLAELLHNKIPTKTKVKALHASDAHECFVNARHLLLTGTGAKDGMRFLKKAHEGGDIDAAYTLGYIFSSFRSRHYIGEYDAMWWHCKADDKFAYEHFLFAAERGHPKAMMEVGTMLTWGAGCKRDVVTAYSWFQKAIGKESLCDAGCAICDEYTVNGLLLPMTEIYSRTVSPYCSEKVIREITDEGVFLTIADGVLVDVLAPKNIPSITFPKSVKTIPPDILSGLTNLKKSYIPFRDHNE